MTRWMQFVVFAVAALTPATNLDAGERKPGTAADKVKAAITANKLTVDGKQELTIRLEIERGVWLYANPVNHNNDFLNDNRLTLKIDAQDRPVCHVTYPPGKTRGDDKEKYDIYEGSVTIRVVATRVLNDRSPLDIRIRVHGALEQRY